MTVPTLLAVSLVASALAVTSGRYVRRAPISRARVV